MIFFWTAMRCCSSLIQLTTKLAERQSGQFSAVLLAVASRRMLWVLGAVQSWEARAEAEKEGSRVGREGEQQGRKRRSGTSLNGHQVLEVPHALGLRSWVRMSDAAPAHQPPQRCGQLNTSLEKPLSQRLFRVAGFKTFMSKISLSYRKAVSTYFLI